MISTYQLPEGVFAELADGGGGQATVRFLCEAQQSKHLMLLYALAEAADDPGCPPAGRAAFRAGYGLLSRIQSAHPDAMAWLLGLPHLGGWAHDCLIRLEQGSSPDLASFACIAAAGGLRAGIGFKLRLPVRNGGVLLPGLGFLRVDDRSSWVQLCSDGQWVTIGDDLKVACECLVPDDGSGGGFSLWRGTPLVRAIADGARWEVLLETADPYLDRYTLPMLEDLPADEIERWRDRIQIAWATLVRHHNWAAKPIAAGISVIVPLTPLQVTDLVSATTPAAFGAIATSWPPDPPTMAETLVHEFQHVKLCGLTDMLALAEPGDATVYAPWRQDPRPAGGLLQGVYAHLGIARFWRTQRNVETSPDDILRAHVQFARWRTTVGIVTGTLLRTGCLTPVGVRFVDAIRRQGLGLESDPVPAEAQAMADEAALDHWLTWQIRHIAVDGSTVAGLTSAYQRGESFAAQDPPRTWIAEDTRKIGSTVRSRLLNMRFLAPARYRELFDDGVSALNAADQLLLRGDGEAAVQAYRAAIVASADPQLEAWVGLGLALHRLSSDARRQAVATHLALMFELHANLDGSVDPLDVVAWFA